MAGSGVDVHDHVIDGQCRASAQFGREEPGDSGCAYRCAPCRPARTSATAMVGPMGACFMYGHLVGGGKFLMRRGERRAASPLFGFALFRPASISNPPRSRRYSIELCVARQALPVRPPRVAGDLLCGLNRFPFRGRNDSHEIAFHDDLGVRKFCFVQLAGRTSVEPSVFGCTTRPCSIPGRRTSVAQTALADTFA